MRCKFKFLKLLATSCKKLVGSAYYEYVLLWQAMAEAAKPARILETRKTAPGLRLVDKWAVRIFSPVRYQLHILRRHSLVLSMKSHHFP